MKNNRVEERLKEIRKKKQEEAEKEEIEKERLRRQQGKEAIESKKKVLKNSIVHHVVKRN